MMIEVAAVQPFIVLLVLYNVNADVNTNAHTDNVFPYNQEHFLKEYFSLLHPVLISIISGCFCFLLCWTLSYFNWLKIGDFPSSPSVLSSPGASQADTLHASKSEFAYATPIFMSIVATGILLIL